MKRIGVDIGGTFTDIVYIDDESMDPVVDKVRSTPSDIARAVFEAVAKIGVNLSGIELFVHGTTIGLNTVVQRAGSRVGLITTDGFTDVLEMGRGDRKELYNYLWKKPKPLIPRSLRMGIRERTNHLGEILAPVSEEDVNRVLKILRDRGVESIAVCLLHSYANPENEKEVGRLIADTWPGVEFSLSHQVAREFREFERMSTTVLDAYIKRRVVQYLSHLNETLIGNTFGGRLLIVSPNGVLGLNAVKETAIATFASGPIGGVAGATSLAALTGYKDLVTMDVGGTSFDVSLIKGGQGLIRHQFELLGYPVLMAGMDIRPIGAGGGSIARVDSGGLLTVGPESAGADPGPMCYGLGGIEPTVTDAALVNGLIDPDFFLGGEVGLNVDLAREGVCGIAEKLGLDIHEAADGIIAIARNNMTTATKEILIGQGYDPRDFSLVSYGGAGGIFAAGIGKDMSMPRVIVPPNPGVFSARGMLNMDVTHSFAQTFSRSLESLDVQDLMDIYLSMETRGRSMLREERIADSEIAIVRSIDMCYEGQGHYVEVPVTDGSLGDEARAEIARSFHALHKAKYGHSMQGMPATINLRLKAIGKIRRAPAKESIPVREIPPAAYKRPRSVYSEREHAEWRVLDRDLLLSGNSLEGPAIVEEPHHVTIVMPRQMVEVDRFQNLVIHLR